MPTVLLLFVVLPTCDLAQAGRRRAGGRAPGACAGADTQAALIPTVIAFVIIVMKLLFFFFLIEEGFFPFAVL